MANFRLAILLAATAFAGCAYLPETARPRIEAVHPKIEGIDFQGLNMAFDMDVFNPLIVPLNTPNMRYGLALAGQPVMNESNAPGFQLPASGSGTAHLPIRIGFDAMRKALGGASGANQVDYAIDGAFLFNAAEQSFEVPFTHKGVLPVFQPPKITVQSVQQPSLGATGAQIGLQAIVANPNVFSIVASQLGYSLRLGDKPFGALRATAVNEIPAGGQQVVNLTGQVSSLSNLEGLTTMLSPQKVQVVPVGKIVTPYGDISLPAM